MLYFCSIKHPAHQKRHCRNSYITYHPPVCVTKTKPNIFVHGKPESISGTPLMRKIIHIDMDAFYASIEQRDNPALRGIPIAVGYDGPRGVVAAASYEARRYGVHSALPSITAKARCPHLIFVPGRHDVYEKVSHEIMDIFHEYTDLVEPLSLDEAYLDVTTDKKNIRSATLIAEQIKCRIRESTGLTASAGVSYNKFLAKVASDQRKPDGLFVILPGDAEEFIGKLPVERFWGVGKVTYGKMKQLGIRCGADLRNAGEDFLVRHFGKAGKTFYMNACAVDERGVEAVRIPKSIGSENTFMSDIADRELLRTEMKPIAEEVWRRATEGNFQGRTVTLKIKYEDFTLITRSKTLSRFVDEYDLFTKTAESLLDIIDLSSKKVRLLGLSINNPGYMELPKAHQLEIDFTSCGDDGC